GSDKSEEEIIRARSTNADERAGGRRVTALARRRLWFSNWGAQEIIAVDVAGKSEVMLRVATTVPFSIDWLPDGRLLVVSGAEARLLRQEPDGSLATYADLSGLARGWNEIVVDGHGNTYVNGSDYQFAPGEPFVPGV